MKTLIITIIALLALTACGSKTSSGATTFADTSQTKGAPKIGPECFQNPDGSTICVEGAEMWEAE